MGYRLLAHPVRLIKVISLQILLLLAAVPAFASAPLACAGNEPVIRFNISIRPFSQGAPLPLKSVGTISAGSRLIWSPVYLGLHPSSSAEVAAVLVPVSNNDLMVLEPRKASRQTDWQLIEQPQVIALLYGPQGLSEGKIQSLVTHDRELLKELADYAEESSAVETLVQRLADAEQSGGGADAVLKGFSSQYGVTAPKLDSKASSDQQAALLLKMALPASAAYDPLANRNVQVQQSGGLAASVAGMFFGNPVALAAGGATLFQSLKAAMFPNTEFHSAFTQAADNGHMALCTKKVEQKSKTRIAYLWAYRVPKYKKPTLSVDGSPHLAQGSKSMITVRFAQGSTPKEFEFARDWRLTPVSGGASLPVEVTPGAAESLTIDLSKPRPPRGGYRLEALWDWSPLTVAGTVHVDPYDDFAHITVAPGERDKLVESDRPITVKLTGADFEFLDKAALESSSAEPKPAEVGFTLPVGKRRGSQNSVKLNLGAPKQGSYRLLLAQSDGVEHAIPITILPPSPQISNRPVRVNLGETRKMIHFQGTGLERIEAVSSKAGEITGAPDAQGWSGEIALTTDVVKGQRFPVMLKVQGLDDPVTIADAIEIVGPRPQIRSVRKSLVGGLGIEIADDELPVGAPVGLVFTVDRVKSGARLQLELGCETGGLRQLLKLSPGEASLGANLTFAGPEALYLSVDPGAIGYAGCGLAARLIQDPEGRSDPLAIGRLIRIPHVDRFTLTTEKVGDATYTGILEGHDLDVIEKTGWDADHALAVQSIPTPLPNDPSRQSLRVLLSWPAPAPHAPLYVWLRGESSGRKTTVVY